MKAFYYNQRLSARILAVLAMLSLIASLVPMQAFAVHDPFGGVEQTSVLFCHQVGNGSYNTPNSSVTATGGQVSLPQGHSNNQHSGDIIPPFHFAGGSYPGQNWNASTQDIWASGNCDGDGIVGPTTATLTVNKVVVGGDDAATAFGFKVNGGSTVSFDADGSVPQTVNLSTYAVVENGVTAGKVTIGADEYAVTYSAGCSGTLTASGATCTITNTFVPTTGTLNITKVISGIQGILASAFSFIVNGGASVPFDGTDNTNSVPSVPAGAYTVVEAGVTAGNVTVGPNTYSVGYSAGCSSSLIAGGSANCTITNTFIPNPVPGCMDVDANNYSVLATVDNGSCLFNLTVNKVVTASTSPNYAMFSFTVDGGETTPFESSGSKVVVVGSTTHTVVEDAEAGYSASYSNCSNVVVTGGNAVCTITNTLGDDTTITINKVTSEVNAQTFNFFLDGSAVSSATLAGGQSSGALLASVGSHNIIEGTVAGWTLTNATCVNEAQQVVGSQDGAPYYLTLAAGDDVTCTFTNTKDTTPIELCDVNVVSDLSNTVNATGTVIVTNQPGSWVDNIVGSVAQWIWGAASTSPISGTVDETQTFTKTFVWNGPVSGATLKLATDNMYSVTLNGTEVASSTAGDNFTSVDTVINISDNIVQGTNTLAISVTNDANNQTTLAGNPAGLIYDLTVVGNTQDNCTQVPGGGNNDNLSCSITASDSSIRRGGDVTLNWSAIGAASATITGIDGVISLPGSKIIENLSSDTTYTMTVLGDYIGDSEVRESDTCSITVDTRSGGGGGGTRVNRTPSGNVLGASDSPKPLVLGDQVDAVPTGAPNTGKGGASTLVLGQLLAMPRRRNHS